MRKELQIERIRKSGHITSVIARVLEIILIILCVIWALSVLAALQIPGLTERLPVIVSSGAEGTFIGRIGSFIGTHAGPAAGTAVVGILAAVGVACEIISLHRICILFKNITKGASPFVPEAGRTVRVMAVFLAIGMVLAGGGILPALVAAVALWTVSLILDYGYTLQCESDEII